MKVFDHKAAEKFVLTHSGSSLDKDEVLELFLEALQAQKIVRNTFRYGIEGKKLSLDKVRASVRRSSKRMIDLAWDELLFSYFYLPACDLTRIQITTARHKTEPWDVWATTFLRGETFISAWVEDSEYVIWQRSEFPIVYEQAGRPHAHLPRVSNGLGPPYEELVIDTSDNPGRFDYRDDYVEAVGSLMWIGKSFWKLTGANQSAVENCEWLKVSEPTPGVLRLQAQETLFQSDQGEEGALQWNLRKLLFPKSPITKKHFAKKRG